MLTHTYSWFVHRYCALVELVFESIPPKELCREVMCFR